MFLPQNSANACYFLQYYEMMSSLRLCCC
uniref:Uncharacterized protein n=1 Tax=Rhizophora mucronata TaxID=61149 RepID=A0A2P2NZZ1_RHIMU